MWQLQPGVLSRAAIDGLAGIPLSIGGTPVTTATEGVAYSGFTVAATGGTPAYAYSVASGTLPSGITLNSSSGAVSGTPTTAGTYASIVIRATDALSATADLASFTITVAAAAPALDGIASLTGAWSFSRDLRTSFIGGTRYTKSATQITALNDQSGNSRNFTAGVSATRPLEATAFPASVLCADFDGTDDYLPAANMSNFVTSTSGAMVVSVIIDAVTVNDADAYNNHGILSSGLYIGLYARNLSGVTLYSHNWDGSADVASATGAVATAYVLMWRHHGGNLYFSINGGAETSVASGATSSLANVTYLGFGSSAYCNMKVAEVFTTSDGSQTAALATAVANMKTHVGI